jgi:HK97 family phage major capsid protein
MKKYIMIDGVKHYLEDEADSKGGPGEGDKPTPPVEEPENLDEEANKAAKIIGASLRKELGIDELKKQVESVKSYMDQPENAKLKTLLHGKNIVTDKDKLTKEEKIVGFFHALVTRNEAAVKALSEGTAADGGYLFPDEFLAELVRPLSEPGTMRSLVRVITMRRDIMEIPTLVNRPKIYWTAENAAKTTTTANFYHATLTARKAAAIIYASDELIEDSTEIDIVNLIITLFSEAITQEEDRVILRGNGTTEPTGIVVARAAATIGSVACSGNLDFDDILELIYGLKTKYRKGASFLVHPTNVKELRKLKDTTGRYIYMDPSTPEGYATLYGYPVHEFYDMPESEIEFGNWKLCYFLGDRKKMTVKISQDTTQAFTQDETAIRVVIRLGGNVVLGEAAYGLITIP